MESQSQYEAAQAKIHAVSEAVGREIRLFLLPAAVPSSQLAAAAAATEAAAGATTSAAEATPPAATADTPPEDFYELTAADYARLTAPKKQESGFKLRRTREQEQAEKKSRIKKATIRVQFLDGIVIEATFLATETIADVRRLVTKCLRDPSLPFFFFTTPPKTRLKNEQLDLYDASLAPRAILHFAREGAGLEDKILREDVLEIMDLHLLKAPDSVALERETKDEINKAEENETSQAKIASPVPAPKSERSGGKPRWFKR